MENRFRTDDASLEDTGFVAKYDEKRLPPAFYLLTGKIFQ